MKKWWMMVMAGWLAVFGVGAQPPIAALHLGPSGNSEKWIDLIEESSAYFDLKGGLIFVEASLNGRLGHFILDTGAPGLVLNQEPSASSGLEGVGVTGSIAVEETVVESFGLGGVQFRELRAYKIDLEYLEVRLGRQVDGLIGYEVLKGMEVLIDYPNQAITLIPAGRVHESMGERSGYFDFFLVNHIPALEASLGRRDIILGVDTGAGANVLNRRLGKPYREKSAEVRRIRGIDRGIKTSALVRAPVLIEGYEKASELEYWLANLSHFRDGSGGILDGLLGFPFLRNGKWSIHYGEQRIYIWE